MEIKRKNNKPLILYKRMRAKVLNLSELNINKHHVKLKVKCF